jgi:hypothetical protein
MENEPFKVTVRWWDGYLEEFDAIESRVGAYMLWIKFPNGGHRWIPLCQVRWFEGPK